MNKRPLAITTILIIAALALAAATLALMAPNSPITASGKLASTPNIGIYADSACRVSLSDVDWGSVNAGTSVTRTFYIKNLGGSSLTLSMATCNWEPAAANGPLAISWDREGAKLTPGKTITAHITLTTAQTITDITTFTTQINITAKT